MTKQDAKVVPWRLFISYSSQDRAFVRKLVADLRASSMPIWFAEWELGPGDSLIDKIGEGIEQRAIEIE